MSTHATNSSVNTDANDSEAPDVRRYDIRAIEIATVFSAVVGGSFLLSRNFKALGQHAKARNALIFGLLGMIAVSLIAFSVIVRDAVAMSTVAIDRHDDKSIVVQGWDATELRGIVPRRADKTGQ